jgi:hypothetical protein
MSNHGMCSSQVVVLHIQLSGALVDSVRSGGVWCVVLRKDCMCIVLDVYVCCDRLVVRPFELVCVMAVQSGFTCACMAFHVGWIWHACARCTCARLGLSGSKEWCWVRQHHAGGW